jgi:hypothetical protein
MTAPALHSAPFGESQAVAQCHLHSGRVSVKGLPNSVLLCRVLALIILALPCGQKALALQGTQAAGEVVYISSARALAIGAGATKLGQQPSADWLGGIVQFFTPIAPQGGAVAQQQAQQERNDRHSGVLQQFKHRHPVLFNLAFAAIAFLAGFYITGGFGGGK